jgi:hypothetical protein
MIDWQRQFAAAQLAERLAGPQIRVPGGVTQPHQIHLAHGGFHHERHGLAGDIEPDFAYHTCAYEPQPQVIVLLPFKSAIRIIRGITLLLQDKMYYNLKILSLCLERYGESSEFQFGMFRTFCKLLSQLSNLHKLKLNLGNCCITDVMLMHLGEELRGMV